MKHILLLLVLAASAFAQQRPAICSVVDTGGDDDYSGTCTTGTVWVLLTTNVANTGACTLDVGAGPSAIKHGGASDPSNNTIGGSGKKLLLAHDGTYWQIIAPFAPTVSGAAVDPYDTVDLVDEFAGGGNSTLVVGDLGWSFTTGTVSSPSLASPTADIWGFFRRNTAATASSFATTYLWNAGNMVFPSTGAWTMTYRVKAGSTWDANTIVQVGAHCASNLTTDPSAGIYLRVSGATTANWFTVTRSASTETANDTGIAAGTGWTKIVIRRIDASTIGFKIGTASETQHTTNIPSAQCNPWFSVANGATAAVASLDVEFFRLTATSGR